MAGRIDWSRNQRLVAFNLYCQIPFGKMHRGNPDIIRYANLIGRTPSALAMKLTNIASLDPAITSTGRKGLSGASAADKAMWAEMKASWEAFALEANRAECDFGITPEQEKADDPLDYSGADRDAQVKVRVGQKFFRRSVLSAYNYRCCITGLAVPKLLVASHIVPWRSDVENRLNPENGLCLSMLHDKAFDAGVITIEEDLTVCVSSNYTDSSDAFFKSAILAYHGKPMRRPEKFSPSEIFLSHHRKNTFVI